LIYFGTKFKLLKLIYFGTEGVRLTYMERSTSFHLNSDWHHCWSWMVRLATNADVIPPFCLLFWCMVNVMEYCLRSGLASSGDEHMLCTPCRMHGTKSTLEYTHPGPAARVDKSTTYHHQSRNMVYCVSLIGCNIISATVKI
jgi:hypothetical protein